MGQELSVIEAPYPKSGEKALICTYFDSSKQYAILRTPYNRQYLDTHKLADGDIYSETHGVVALSIKDKNFGDEKHTIAKLLRYDLSTGEFAFWRVFEPRLEILEDLTQSDIEEYGLFVGSSEDMD